MLFFLHFLSRFLHCINLNSSRALIINGLALFESFHTERKLDIKLKMQHRYARKFIRFPKQFRFSFLHKYSGTFVLLRGNMICQNFSFLLINNLNIKKPRTNVYLLNLYILCKF